MSLHSKLAETEDRPPPDFGLAQVNIVLLLVLFFLVVGTIVETSEMAVDLSQTSDLPLERLPRPLLLITQEGGWSLDGEKLSHPDVIARLTENVDQATTVHILAPRDMPADMLIVAMQALQVTGLGVTLVTLKSVGSGE
ncbi:MAG: biopolymer transport protein ExbD [Paracoccaceae bacterium]|jgi:biopolymer transport protein ExbD